MTMDLSDSALFKAYLVALTAKQLDALVVWQEERLSDKPGPDIIADALMKKKQIWEEKRRRLGSSRS